MPLSLDLNSYRADAKVEVKPKEETSGITQVVAGYAHSIFQGIGRGLSGIPGMIGDFAVYPLLDAHVMLALATHPEFDEIDAIMQQHPEIHQGIHERMESRANTLYQLSLLALDTGVLWAKYDGQNPDIQEFQTLIRIHPEMCQEAESRMHQRADNWRNMYHHFMQSTGQDKAESISELATAFLGPGALLKSLGVLSTGVRNLREFGMFCHPPKFPTLNTDLFSMPPFKLLHTDEIKKTAGMLDCVWVLTKENQLLIAPAEFSKGFQPAQMRVVTGKIEPHHLTRMARCDWVYASGEAMFNDGKLIGLFNDITSYKPEGTHLESFVSRAFEKNGFGKEYKMRGFDGSKFTINKSSLALGGIQISGLVSATHHVRNNEVGLIKQQCEHTLKLIERLDLGHIVSSNLSVETSKVNPQFQQEFIKHFRGIEEHEVSNKTDPHPSPPASFCKPLSVQHGISHDQQIQQATSSMSRSDFNLPAKWQTADENVRQQTLFFNLDKSKALPQLSFNPSRYFDAAGTLPNSSLLSSHSMFSSEIRQVGEIADNFQRFCKSMQMSFTGTK